MPVYQYECGNCKLYFELKQNFNDKPLATCPACHGAARRLFLPVPILFKGPGFYITDSRAEKGGNEPGVKIAKEEGKGEDKS